MSSFNAAIQDAPALDIAKAMVASATNIGTGLRIVPARYNASLSTVAQDIVAFLNHNLPDLKHLDFVFASCHNPALAGDPQPPSAPVGSPKFFAISTSIGSVASGPEIPFKIVEYSMSKAALKWWARKADLEEHRIAAVPVHP